MTGLRFDVLADDSGVVAGLRAIIARMERPVGFYKNVGEFVLGRVKDNFAGERDPEGVPWRKLLPKTIRARERRKLVPIRILRARGRLLGSVSYRAGLAGLTVGSPMPYAAIHQLGGTIKMPARTQTIYQHYDAKADEFDSVFRKKSRSNFARDVQVPAHDIVMPARPWIGITAGDEEVIFDFADVWVTGERTDNP